MIQAISTRRESSQRGDFCREVGQKEREKNSGAENQETTESEGE